MITLRQQTPPDVSRIAHHSQVLQNATIHSKKMTAKKHIPKILSRVGLLVLSIVSASALAESANDFIENAQDVFIGFSDTFDTSDASTDDTDLKLNEFCGYQNTDASVWFKFTATSDTNVIIDASQSNYSTGFLIGAGTPDDLYLLTCGPSTIGFYAVEGETYYILAFDDQSDGSGNGGVLNISVSEALTPVLEDFTVNRFGQFDPRTGAATISGTYTCTNGDYISVYPQAKQTVGRIILSGYGEFSNSEHEPCNGESQLWSAEIVSSNGKFGGGKAMTVSSTYACGWFECTYGYTEYKVQLRGGRRN